MRQESLASEIFEEKNFQAFSDNQGVITELLPEVKNCGDLPTTVISWISSAMLFVDCT